MKEKPKQDSMCIYSSKMKKIYIGSTTNSSTYSSLTRYKTYYRSQVKSPFLLVR